MSVSLPPRTQADGVVMWPVETCSFGLNHDLCDDDAPPLMNDIQLSKRDMFVIIATRAQWPSKVACWARTKNKKTKK